MHRESYVDPRREETQFESSTETFDRVKFAEWAVSLVAPSGTRVAICGGVQRLSVRVGRQWGEKKGSRWAVLGVPETASRRAIALAVASLALPEGRRYALDVLLSDDLAAGPELASESA